MAKSGDDAPAAADAPSIGGGPGGRLTENIMHFARVLRAAGLPIGPGRVLDAVRAVHTVGLGRREDFYWTLHAVFVNRRDQRELFDQVFHIFWRNPDILERMMALVLPDIGASRQMPANDELSRRVAEALAAGQSGEGRTEETRDEEIVLDAAMTWSPDEVLREKDFEKMSADEVRDAVNAVKRMRLPISEVPTRRFRADPRGRRADMRRTMRAALRSGSDIIPLMKRSRRRRRPPLVIICDVSGSMDRYSRMLVHFLHAVTNDRDRVYTFLFGTRLTNITRYLRYRDVDQSLKKVSEVVEDWAGGTRIGHCVYDFNRQWSRRVLSQGAVVLLISDGLDRDEGYGLAREMERLHKSCRRLIWLNPLLRYDKFQPRSAGMRAILPHVDELRSVHNLNSLAELTEVLSATAPRRFESMAKWRQAAA